MTNLSPPPIQEVLADNQGFPNVPWIMFFNNLYQGDTGTEWTPTFVSLTSVGSPTITGSYRYISRQLVFFSVRIVPGTSTSATAGTTYIDNFPLSMTQDGIVFAVSGNVGTASGMVNFASNRIYVPAWSVVTNPITIVGVAEVSG